MMSTGTGNSSSGQAALFYEDFNDALRAVVQALGGVKKVAGALKPDQTAATATTWLNGCLNDSERAHLTPDQVLWLLREGANVGCHAGMHFAAGHAGYAPPVAQSPRDELSTAMERLKQQQSAVQQTLEATNRALSRLQSLGVA